MPKYATGDPMEKTAFNKTEDSIKSQAGLRQHYFSASSKVLS